jgi:hypothetical protein
VPLAALPEGQSRKRHRSLAPFYVHLGEAPRSNPLRRREIASRASCAVRASGLDLWLIFSAGVAKSVKA